MDADGVRLHSRILEEFSEAELRFQTVCAADDASDVVQDAPVVTHSRKVWLALFGGW
jgi:hypothetical protein